MDKLELELEAILFVAGTPVPLSRLAAAVAADPKQVAKALDSLKINLQARGIKLARTGSEYSLLTNPAATEAIERYLGASQRSELSKPALETMAIIAFRQPLTKTEIDQIRGVSSDQTIKNLLLRGLIEENGRAEIPGRPILYRTSLKFLEILGLSDAAELPKVDGIEIKSSKGESP